MKQFYIFYELKAKLDESFPWLFYFILIWEEWETETKKVYESHFRELMNLGEVASAMKVKEFLCDVDEELKCVQRKVLELKAIDYDLSIIVPMQDEIHDKYKEKLDNMKYNF